MSFGENSITKLERIGVFMQLSDNFKRSSQTFTATVFFKWRNDHNISLGESGKSACTSHNNITTQKIRSPFLAFHIFPIKEYLYDSVQYTIIILSNYYFPSFWGTVKEDFSPVAVTNTLQELRESGTNLIISSLWPRKNRWEFSLVL